jgi:putative ABC transport system permease protein
MYLSRFLQTLRLGIKSLLLHKLRSALAVLGILIGVTAVIWLVAMGEGVSFQAQQQIKDLGATNVIVRSVKPTMSSSAAAAGSFFVDYGLRRDDFDRLRNIPTVVQAAPIRELAQKDSRYLDRSLDVRIVGCRTEYQSLNQLTLEKGRFISDSDEANVENVCVLAHETARTLFRYEDPLGKSVSLDGEFYVVVGVTNERSASGNIGGSFTGQDYNRDAYIPLRTLRARIGDMVLTAKAGGREGEVLELSQITLTVRDISEVDETATIVKNLLDKYHRNGDFAIVVPKELLKQAEVTRMMFNVLLVLIAGIALIVGGIGIMNIMLATVTERTREIGIRRALGAKQRDIVYQFLAETLVLSLIGGLLGALCGLACPPVVTYARELLNRFFPTVTANLPSHIQQLTPIIAPWSVAAAVVISLVVGIVFGMYPARRASLMDPIEALRHE